MARSRHALPALAVAALVAAGLLAGAPLAGCSGGSSPDCSVQGLNAWVLAQARAYYLFVQDIPAGIDPATFPTTRALLDKIMDKVPAGADPATFRRFSYMTTQAAVSQHYQVGTSQGYGIGLRYVDPVRVFVSYVLGGSPAAQAGFARGDELLAIAASADLLTADASQVSTQLGDPTGAAFSAALGSGVLGTTRVFKVRRADGTTEAVLTATVGVFSLDPVPAPQVFTVGARKVGYLTLRTFIDPAVPLLDAAFGELKAQEITDLVVDLRYNGGGYVHVASDLLDLLAKGHGGVAAGRGDVQFWMQYNAQLSSANQRFLFAYPEAANAFDPGADGRIAFIVSGDTASASEVVPFALRPYLGGRVALVGAHTLGKPAGQNGLVPSGCQDVLFLLTFQFSDRDQARATYWSGLPDGAFAATGSSCAAPDDLAFQLGDVNEKSLAAALQWIGQGTCPAGPIATTDAPAPLVARAAPHRALRAAEPTLAQRDLAGLF